MRHYTVKIALLAEAEDAEQALSKINEAMDKNFSRDYRILSYIDEGGEETIVSEQ